MFLKEFQANNFRNLEVLKIELSSDLNIFIGENAAGKSSVLEAISYFVCGRSFRTNKNNLLVSHQTDSFTLFGRFSDMTKLGVSYQKHNKLKRIKINERFAKSLSSVTSLYPVQVLSPESYHLIDSGPLERRKYLDWLLFHVEHKYQNLWNIFNKLLKQRNAYLRTHKNSIHHSEIDSWNNQFVCASTQINELRNRITNDILLKLKPMLKCMNFEYVDEINISFYPGYTSDLKEKLDESFTKDLLTGNTQYGPHKADLRIKFGKYLAKDILSRGQKKLLVNALYLSQTQLLKEKTKKNSLFVVDDFTSELDFNNQISLISTLRQQENVQVILSCLHASMIKTVIREYNNVKMFHVKHGVVTIINT